MGSFYSTDAVADNELQMFTTADDVQENRISQGMLYKQPTSLSHSIDPKRWKERYFVLKRGGLYYYAVGRTEFEFTLSSVANVIREEFTATLDGVQSGYILSIQLNDNNERIHLAASSKSIAERWVKALTCKEDHKVGLLYYLIYPKTIWEKWVVRKIIKKKDCVIIRDVSLMGHVSLSNAKVERIDGNTLRVIERDGRMLTLLCGDEESCNSWFVSINATCQMETGLCVTSPTNVLDFYNVLRDVVENGLHLVNRVWKSKDVVFNDDTPFFVLSIDGGGSRGIIPCILLERIFEQFPDILSRVNYVTGTSNGSMIAMALAFGYHPKTIRETMEVTASAVFSEQHAKYSLSSPRWCNRFLSIFCNEIWGEHKMSESHLYCMVPAFLLDNKDSDNRLRKTEIQTFTSYSNTLIKEEFDPLVKEEIDPLIKEEIDPLVKEKFDPLVKEEFDPLIKDGLLIKDGPKKEIDKREIDPLVKDVVMRSCAAPIYFPAYQNYVDGGLFAHNPSDIAITDIVSKLGVPIHRVCVLSIGTGKVNRHFPSDVEISETNANTHNYGYYQWIPKLAEVLWDGMVQKTNQIASALLGIRFHRIDPILNEDFALDSPAMLPILSEYGKKEDIDQTLAWIRQHIYNDK